MKTAIKVFLAIGLISGILLVIIGLITIGIVDSPAVGGSITCLILGIINACTALKAFADLADATKREELVTTGILTLIFCNFIAGILILCVKESDLLETKTEDLDNNLSTPAIYFDEYNETEANEVFPFSKNEGTTVNLDFETAKKICENYTGEQFCQNVIYSDSENSTVNFNKSFLLGEFCFLFWNRKENTLTKIHIEKNFAHKLQDILYGKSDEYTVCLDSSYTDILSKTSFYDYIKCAFKITLVNNYDFQSGESVFHRKYGAGRIFAINGNYVTVDFYSCGKILLNKQEFDLEIVRIK